MEPYGYHRGLKVKWQIPFFISLFLTSFLISFILISNSTSSYTLYSGSFNLYLNQNGSVGSQLLEYYVAIQYLNSTPINTTANIIGKIVNEVYSSKLRFTTNTNGTIQILTNLNQTIHHFIKITIDRENTFASNNSLFSFDNGDNIIIYFEVSNPIWTKEHINAIIGIVGIGLFCANPILSYVLTNKAKDKFHFLFILIGIGLISLGLIFSFIYGG